MEIANQCNNKIFLRFLLKDPRLNDESRESSPIVDNDKITASDIIALFGAIKRDVFLNNKKYLDEVN